MMREWFYKNERFVLGYLEQLQRLRRTSSAPPYILLFFPKSKSASRLLQKTSFVTIIEIYGKVEEKITQNL